MIGVAVRDNDRAQILDRDVEQVEVSAETIGRQPPVGEDRASLPVGLDGDEGGESVLGDQLLACQGSEARYRWTSSSDDLCGFAGVDPAAEDGDTLGGPCSVARHRAGLEPVEDGVGVRRDVVEGPEIEGEAHRVAVALAEQWLDVLLEADWLVRSGHPRDFAPRPSVKATGGAPVAEMRSKRVGHGGQRALSRSERGRDLLRRVLMTAPQKVEASRTRSSSSAQADSRWGRRSSSS